jgi:hypothetical protein
VSARESLSVGLTLIIRQLPIHKRTQRPLPFKYQQQSLGDTPILENRAWDLSFVVGAGQWLVLICSGGLQAEQHHRNPKTGEVGCMSAAFVELSRPERL